MCEQSYILPSSVRQVVSAIAKTLASRFALISMLLALPGVPSARLLAQTPTPVAVPTWRYDMSHAGQNTSETALTPANVNSTSFGKLFSHTVNGNMYAQPLYMPALTVNGQPHNVVFVATENDIVYAFDADSNGGANANPLWTANLASTAYGAAAGATYIQVDSSQFLSDILPNVGITGTPVIDPTTNTMYVVASTYENDEYIVRLHALNILTGGEQANSPVAITGSVPGTGNGSSGGVLPFSPYWNNQRPALAFYNGYVYIGFGAHGDEGLYHGWLFAYKGSTMQQTAVFCMTPNGIPGSPANGGNGGGGGIWASGAGLPIDTDGTAGAARLFLVNANGDFDANDWGESILNFSLGAGTLNIADSFTSFNQASLTQSDLDQGSGGILMVPDHPSAQHPHIMVQVGKEGRILVLDRDNLGGYAHSATSNTNILQDITGQTGGLWSTPAYWNDHVYMWGAQDNPKMFDLDPTTGLLSTTPSSAGSATSNNPGASFSVSSNGTQDGIAWVVRSDAYTSHGAEVMYAYDATDLTNVLYETDTNATRDNPGDAMKFSIPVVTNGKVYVISDGNYSGQLNVYGLLNAEVTTATPVITPNGGSYQAAQTVTIASTTPNAAIYYTLDGTAPTTASTPYTAALSISTDTTVNAIASAPGDLQSAVSTATFTFTGQTPTPGFTPAAGTYAGTQSVTIADTDTNAKIYYTIDGSTPTASSTLYAAPITVSASETINAIAIDPALTNSSVATAPYVITAAGPTIDFSAGFANVTGLTMNGSTENNNDSRLELTDGLLNQAGSAFWNQPVGVSAFSTQFLFQLSDAVADGFTFTIQNVGPTALGSPAAALGYTPINKSVAIKFDIYSNAGEGTDSTGVYTDGALPENTSSIDMTSSGVILRSGDGMLANVTYDGTTLTMVLTDGTTNNTFTHSWPINIPATVGANTAYVGFTAGTGGFTASQKILTWTYTDLSAAAAPTPTFTPAAGTYAGTQNVTIADTDTNAAIYYTINGSTPTAASTLYTAPITVSASETINAIAIDPALTNSSVATAAYVISATPVTPTPTFTPAAGTYAGTQNVTIADTDANAAIHYTTNGSTPTAASTLYTAAIAVTASETINAIAIDPAMVSSNVATAAYVISATPPASFTMSGSTVSIVAGATTGNTSTITITPPTGGFTGSVVLTAAIASSPAGAVNNPPTFSFGATSPVSVSGTTAATATLTVNTTAATTTALANPKDRGVPWYATGGAALACILLFGIPSRRRTWRAMLGMVLFLLIAASGMLACGGSGGGGGGTTNPGTTAGAYTITVTGTSGTVVETTTVNLTVQ